jgi:hypothetical protein
MVHTEFGINGFFFREPQGPDYLSPNHPNYSPKLAAAIAAWVAVSKDPELRKGKTVKQALDVWLRLHANEFGLTKEDGNPNDKRPRAVGAALFVPVVMIHERLPSGFMVSNRPASWRREWA